MANVTAEDAAGAGSVPAANWWALLALLLVVATAAGNILVCLAITWERRLQNVTNYFLMSLAITDLMVAVLVMPLGILTLVRGYFPLAPVYCLAWICLDVLFCTASIMHLTTISVDRYLSLRYPMKFGRNKTRRRVTLKIVFVWLLSVAMSLPLSLMYSQDHDSVVVDGTCQIPDPLYKLIGSIVCFYIPLGVMLLTYALTVRLLAVQQQNLCGGGGANSGVGGGGWSSGWLGPAAPQGGGGLERRGTWRRLLGPRQQAGGPQQHSAASTDTELSALDLWLPEEQPPSAASALSQFGAEMLRLSRRLECVAAQTPMTSRAASGIADERSMSTSPSSSQTSLFPQMGSAATASASTKMTPTTPTKLPKRRASMFHEAPMTSRQQLRKRRGSSFHETSSSFSAGRHRLDSQSSTASEGGTAMDAAVQQQNLRETTGTSDKLALPPPCTCPYFGDGKPPAVQRSTDVVIVPEKVATSASADDALRPPPPSPSSGARPVSGARKGQILSNILRAPTSSSSSGGSNTVVTWDTPLLMRRGSVTYRTSLLTPPVRATPTLRRAATLRHHNGTRAGSSGTDANSLSSPCLAAPRSTSQTVRSHHSRTSSVISRTSSRHGRILRLEQKATKVLGVVFFTFVILWAPFFVLNLLPALCATCEQNIDPAVFDLVTWLGYASSMVNPVFYTIFNKVFRQAFRKVLLCQYKGKTWRPSP